MNTLELIGEKVRDRPSVSGLWRNDVIGIRVSHHSANDSVWIEVVRKPGFTDLFYGAVYTPELRALGLQALDPEDPCPVEVFLDRLVELVGDKYPALCEAVARISIVLENKHG